MATDHTFAVDQLALDLIEGLLDSGATFKMTRNGDGHLVVTVVEEHHEIKYA